MLRLSLNLTDVEPTTDRAEPVVAATALRPPSSAALAAARRRRLNAGLLLVRRVHLYSGLFLVPWVLLYGVTAFLFNHPRAFADAPVVEVDDAGAARLPAAATLSSAVLEALEAAAPGRVVVAAGEPRYEHAVAWRVEAGDAEHLVIVDPVGVGAVVRSSPRPAERPAPPFEVSRVEAGPSAFGAATAAVGSLVAAAGLPAGQVRPRNVPDLLVDVTVDGAPHRVAYDLRTGAVSLTPSAGGGRDVSIRGFLTRLHKAHAYPSSVDARWLWAVIVDVMAAAMVVWALTGVVMWAQMRALRRAGALAIAGGVATAIALAVGMFLTLTR